MILVTGATGFVGKQVVNELLARSLDFKIICSKNKNLDPVLKNKIKNIYYTDNLFTENEQWFDKVLDGIDIVIHLAWHVKPGDYLNSEKNIDCFNGSVHFAKNCIENKIRKFVGIGTCFEYEPNNIQIDVSTKLSPENLYSASKVALYLYLKNLFKLDSVEFLWCRLFYLYGEGEDKNRFYPYIKKKMIDKENADLSDGTQIRDFMNVKDAAKMIVDASLSENTGAFNVCSGNGISIKEFANQIADEFGSRSLLNFGKRPNNPYDPPYIVGKPTKIKK
tara:strand:+ start:137 stop:970 length:834 start_codon:yes stop_codon:yes gene_type:complete